MASVHLLVLIHGMWGNPGHLAELARIIRETYASPSPDGVELEVLLAETNREESTYDGVDWGGERVAQEVLDKVKNLESEGKEIIKFSVTGYSLGGLVARYVIGILHQRGFFEAINPINFNTLATPHIGLPRYPSLMSLLSSSLGPKLLSRTGEQFYCGDHWSASGRPLLEVMADPDRIFYQALSLFQNIRIYANAVNDVTVPYVTSAIETDDPFAAYRSNGIQVEYDDACSPLLKSYALPKVPPPKPVILSPTWFRIHKPRPLLPPGLQLRFPLNIALYTLLSILIPMGIPLVVINLTLASRSSRARIRILESDTSNKERLIHILAELENAVKDVVVDIIDNPEPIPSACDTTQPILSPLQRRIAASLNKLPIKKELAYFDGVRNSHGIIICRDVKFFEIHRKGEGILRHWATSFVL